MIGRSKELEDVSRVASSFTTYLAKIETTLLAGYFAPCMYLHIMATSPQQPISSVPMVAFVERLDCTQIHAVLLFLVKLWNLYCKPLPAKPSKNLSMNYLIVTHFTRNEGCTFVFAHSNGNWFE